MKMDEQNAGEYAQANGFCIRAIHEMENESVGQVWKSYQ